MELSLIEAAKAGTVKPRRKRERIQIMELPPSDEWFQKSLDSFGREVWFVRIQMTGLRTRRYGPFLTKNKGLLFLDRFRAAVSGCGLGIIRSWKTSCARSENDSRMSD